MCSCSPRITLWQRESCERRSCTRRFSEEGSSICVPSLSAFQPLRLLTETERETPVSSSSNSDDRRTQHAHECSSHAKHLRLRNTASSVSQNAAEIWMCCVQWGHIIISFCSCSSTAAVIKAKVLPTFMFIVPLF